MNKSRQDKFDKVVKALKKFKVKYLTAKDFSSILGISRGRGRESARFYCKEGEMKSVGTNRPEGGLEYRYYLEQDEEFVLKGIEVDNKEAEDYTEEDFSYESQVQRLKDEKSTLSSKLTKVKREESLFTELRKQIELNAPRLQTYKPFSKKKPSKNKITETALLCLGDVHADQIVYPERVDNLEKIDFNVM